MPLLDPIHIRRLTVGTCERDGRGPLELRVDRPFLWFIRDRVTGSVLFLGRVSDPRAAVD